MLIPRAEPLTARWTPGTGRVAMLLAQQDARPKYVVSTTRRDFPWQNTVRVQGDLREAVQQIKDRTPAGVLLGSLTLGAELELVSSKTFKAGQTALHFRRRPA